MRDQATITSAAAAAVFATPAQCRIMHCLMAEPLTLAALGRAVQMPLNLLHYHIGRYLALGLVVIDHEAPRAGRAQKVYRATARAFFVPVELLPELPGAEFTRQLRDALDHRHWQSVSGITISHDGQHPHVMLEKHPGDMAQAIEIWLDMGLAAADARALLADLRAVADKYRQRADETKPRYLINLAAVRLADA